MARQGFDMKEKRKSRRLVYHGRHQSAESQGKTAKGEGGKTARKKNLTHLMKCHVLALIQASQS